MNMANQLPTSEQYRAAAHHWTSMDGKARELELLKEPTLAKWAKAHKDLSIAAAEREVKATQEWHDFLMEIAQTRTAANDARAEMDYLAMRHEEEKWRAKR